MLLCTLLLGAAFAFAVEGRVTGSLGDASFELAQVIYAASLSIAFGTLCLSMVLLYAAQRRSGAIMRAELSKRSAFRQAFMRKGSQVDAILLSLRNLHVRTDELASEGSASEAEGGTKAAAQIATQESAIAQTKDFLSILQSYAGSQSSSVFSEPYFRQLLKQDGAYSAARRSIDKLIGVAFAALLCVSCAVFGSALIQDSSSAAPGIIFLVVVITSLVFSGFLALSETCKCHRTGPHWAGGALWGCFGGWVPTHAYEYLSLPAVWGAIVGPVTNTPESTLPPHLQEVRACIAAHLAANGGVEGSDTTTLARALSWLPAPETSGLLGGGWNPDAPGARPDAGAIEAVRRRRSGAISRKEAAAASARSKGAAEDKVGAGVAVDFGGYASFAALHAEAAEAAALREATSRGRSRAASSRAVRLPVDGHVMDSAASGGDVRGRGLPASALSEPGPAARQAYGAGAIAAGAKSQGPVEPGSAASTPWSYRDSRLRASVLDASARVAAPAHDSELEFV